MPTAFDDLKTNIKKSLTEKCNPKTNKAYSDNEIYSIAVAKWKQTHEGVAPKEASKDWRVMEYYAPITEAVNSGKDFIIRGVAINETTTRNGITYVSEELSKAAPSFRNKPIMKDHSSSINDIVGRTTENVDYSGEQRAIMFEAKIMDTKTKEMINDGRIRDVSIGARVQDLVKNEADGSVTAIGLEGMEISLVAIPGDKDANIATAMNESFSLKESLQSGEDLLSEMDMDIELNLREENMEEAENKVIENTEKEVVVETKESVAPVNVNVDMSAVTESIKALAEQVASLSKKVSENEVPAPSADAEEEEKPSAPAEDETKGEVADESEEDETVVAEEGFVVEKADVGKGMQMYRDYSKESGKFNRLCR